MSYLRLKCTKFDFGWGPAPCPTEGAHSAPQIPQLVLRGPTSKGLEGASIWLSYRDLHFWLFLQIL